MLWRDCGIVCCAGTFHRECGLLVLNVENPVEKVESLAGNPQYLVSMVPKYPDSFPYFGVERPKESDFSFGFPVMLSRS